MLGAVLALVAWQWIAEAAPPTSRSRSPTSSNGGDTYLVSVDVHNDGGRAAIDVGVTAQLDVDGDITEVDDSVEFLAGGRTETIEFVFTDDRPPAT